MTNEIHSNTPLRGDIAVWMIITAELLAFSIFFIGFMIARAHSTIDFTHKQAQLDLNSGFINTLALITGSFGVASAIHYLEKNNRHLAARYWFFACLCALIFIVNKSREFSQAVGTGLFESDHAFDLFYLWLGGFHFLHVVFGLLILLIIGTKLVKDELMDNALHVCESGGVYWHMVDLVWLILFPMLYVLR